MAAEHIVSGVFFFKHYSILQSGWLWIATTGSLTLCSWSALTPSSAASQDWAVNFMIIMRCRKCLLPNAGTAWKSVEWRRASSSKETSRRSSSGDWTSWLDPVLTHFDHEFAFIVKILQLSRITNHLPGIQPMGFNQPPYSSGEIPVFFLHFKNRSEAPQTEAPVSVSSRFLF